MKKWKEPRNGDEQGKAGENRGDKECKKLFFFFFGVIQDRIFVQVERVYDRDVKVGISIGKEKTEQKKLKYRKGGDKKKKKEWNARVKLKGKEWTVGIW